MQGSFEKKVQEKLEELQLTPSGPVWDKIEAQIKPEKKRRAFLWLPFIIALLTAAGWWLWQQPEKQDSVTGKTENRSIDPAEVKPGNTLAEKNSPGRSTVLTPANRTTEKQILFSTKIQRLKQGKTDRFLSSQPKKSLKEKDDQHGTSRSEQTTKKTVAELLTEKMPNLAIQQLTMGVPNQAIQQKAIEENKTDLMPVDSIGKKSQPAEEMQPAVKTPDLTAAKPKLAAVSKKWRWNMVLQGGRSSYSSSEPMAVNYDRYLSSPQNTGGNYSGGGVHTPNGVNGGGSFAIGAGVSKPLSQRFQFSIGLQYAYYSSHTQTGSFKPQDTALAFGMDKVNVEGFYQNGSQQDYTNRYHVLEIPLHIDYKLLRSLPLYLSAGASYGYVLKSNALSYDWMANLYYYNEQNLSRHQAFVFASLPYGIVSKKKVGIQLGPVVQYQLTTFQKETGAAVPRQFVAGIKTVVQF